MPQGVRCSVANCTYWAEGNRCAADEIMIDIDRHARADLSAEFATEAGLSMSHKDSAANSASTCCHTFKPKERS